MLQCGLTLKIHYVKEARHTKSHLLYDSIYIEYAGWVNP